MKRLSQKTIKTIEPDISRGWCIYGFFCWNTGSNWMVMRSLQLEAEANGDNGDFFKERCVSITNDMYSCRPESCDGDYRTFSGCCNNLINKQYGQIVKVDHNNSSILL